MDDGTRAPTPRVGRADRPLTEALPPLPHPVAVRGFRWYLDRLARRHFTSVRWLMGERPERWSDGPLLFVANHTNWWDGFLAHQVTAALGLRFQILMDATSLARYPVFRRFGALPVRRGSAGASYADLTAASTRLAQGTALWIFPQGRRMPAGAPIAMCERGAAHLALGHGAPVRLVPVAFRFPFLSEEWQEPCVLLGPSWVVRGSGEPSGRDRADLTVEIERRMAAVVADLDAALATEHLDAFHVLIRGRASINKRMDRVRHAVGELDGPYEERNG